MAEALASASTLAMATPMPVPPSVIAKTLP
jgi:hypothetical protein